MAKVRVAVVSASGTGRKRIIPALRESRICAVTAIHGRNKGLLAEIGNEFGIDTIFTDLEEMIAKRSFDFAVVCSPPFLHRRQVELLVGAGVPVLVEKPLAATLAEGEAIARAARAAGVVIRVAHHLRHHPMFGEIEKELRAETLGELVRARFEWSFRLDKTRQSAVWKLDPTLNGMTPLSDAGIHCVDIAVALFGTGRVVWVEAREQDSGGTFQDVELLTRHGNVSVHTVASWLYGPYSNELLISGRSGEMFCRGFFSERSSNRLRVVANGQEQIVISDSVNPYRAEVEEFAQVVTEPEYQDRGTTIEEAISALEIVAEAGHMLSWGR
jgi:predicted dehydrogenase